MSYTLNSKQLTALDLFLTTFLKGLSKSLASAGDGTVSEAGNLEGRTQRFILTLTPGPLQGPIRWSLPLDLFSPSAKLVTAMT